MEHKKKCGCAEEFDAAIAYKRLSSKFTELADFLTAYIAEANGHQRSIAAGSAEAVSESMAEILSRIVGGKRVPEGGYPECCLVGGYYADNSYDWFCTGVLVHPRIVLTAAHCYDPATTYVVALNTINQNALSSAELIKAKKVLPHPLYQQTEKLNDICVIVLSEAATTPPVQIATTAEINSATATTLVGFGRDNVQSTTGFGIKRYVTVNIESIRRTPDEQLDAAESRYDYESDLEFVAGGRGYDSCNGDSGGPAYITTGGVRKLAGLTSRATRGAQNPCGEGGIYTRVDVHLDFIAGLRTGV